MANWGKILSRGNVEDRRSMRPAAVGGVSVAGILLYLAISLLTEGEVPLPVDLVQNISQIPQQNQNISEFEGQDSYEVFVSTVLGANNDMWKNLLAGARQPYIPPKLVLFRTATESACGVATSQVGPHYCPLDETIYLDETFFDELTNLYGAEGGDVAEAYVISHEVSHHAQNILGIMDLVERQIARNPAIANDLGIKLELQADCFAGLWAGTLKNKDILSPNEISEAMDAAEAVGDDRIQEKVTGRIIPENWTHGSSEQRVFWFTKGYETNNLAACNTFD